MSAKSLLKESFNALLPAITPQMLIEEQCSFQEGTLYVQSVAYHLNGYKKVHLFGSGKAALPMAQGLQKLLGDRICRTLIVGAYEKEIELENCTYLQSSHPLPSQKSVEAATALREAMRECSEEDLYIYLLSGGNSALVELPQTPLSLEEFQSATNLMLHGGMPIEAINCVRKHLSQVKGGRLAQACEATGIVLVLSDVIGDDLHAIGSAPLYCDPTTFGDAIEQLHAYNLYARMPETVRTLLEKGHSGLIEETPKKPSNRIEHYVIGSNTLVLHKAQSLLADAGVDATVITEPLQGDAYARAQQMVTFAGEHQDETRCYLFGGETTVTVKGDGKGGRNQHFCLSLVRALDQQPGITVLSAATDGIDGNSDAAGAVVDSGSAELARKTGVDPRRYLETFNSNGYFAKTGELVISGATHNNMLDIVFLYIESTPQQGDNNG